MRGGFAIATRVLGVAYLRPVIIALLTPKAFLFTPNTSLLLVLLTIAALWLPAFAPEGNPFRDSVIALLRKTINPARRARCSNADLPGCGVKPRPSGRGYQPQVHRATHLAE